MFTRMVAGGTHCRWLFAFVDVTAHEAFPLDGFVAFPHCAVLYLLEITLKSVAVMLLYLGDFAEVACCTGESFLFGYLGKGYIGLYAFLFFLLDGDFKIGGCVTDYAGIRSKGYVDSAAFKHLQEYFAVTQFVGCRIT